MTYGDIETSVDSGQPVELYEFNLLGTRYLYTNAEQDITVGVDVYRAEQGLERGRVVSAQESGDSQLDIEMDGSNSFARLYIGILPGELPEVTVKQLHTSDPDSEQIFIFQGEVATVGFIDDFSRATIACKPFSGSAEKLMLRHTFQGLCNHMLYDERCTVLETSFEESVTVDSYSDRTVSIGAGQLSTEVAGYWEAGFIEFGNEYRNIVAQSGRVMTIDIPFLNDPGGQTVRILPGCDHVIDGDCDTVFSNTINHGGYPYVPTKNPFSGLD